jgi:hypothetical protein
VETKAPKIVIKQIPPQEEEPWKYRKSKEGSFLLVPTKDRIKPNKYNPSMNKKVLKQPTCFRAELVQVGCKTCMWRFSCNKEI